ncbi:hypothetical protein [Bradyrhizobium sp. Ce-3]|uniref:hypothetical protein n=1 Tax=Bradyrhizobium sp. Ce-3 TaxID=2913970 RepID=UPI002087B3CA|nr:hypothetical protein BRSPCE3_43820 [Bradyrhizobium sp. Ce-3]
MRIARGAEMLFRVAAKIPRAETAYFKKKLEPDIDGEEVQLVDEMDEIRKQPFLAGPPRCCFRSISRSLSGSS